MQADWKIFYYYYYFNRTFHCNFVQYHIFAKRITIL